MKSVKGWTWGRALLTHHVCTCSSRPLTRCLWARSLVPCVRSTSLKLVRSFSDSRWASSRCLTRLSHRLCDCSISASWVYSKNAHTDVEQTKMLTKRKTTTTTTKKSRSKPLNDGSFWIFITPEIKSTQLNTQRTCWRLWRDLDVNHTHDFWGCGNLNSFWNNVNAAIKQSKGCAFPNNCAVMYLQGTLRRRHREETDVWQTFSLLPVRKEHEWRDWSNDIKGLHNIHTNKHLIIRERLTALTDG